MGNIFNRVEPSLVTENRIYLRNTISGTQVLSYSYFNILTLGFWAPWSMFITFFYNLGHKRYKLI